jgi:hypothetical protein
MSYSIHRRKSGGRRRTNTPTSKGTSPNSKPTGLPNQFDWEEAKDGPSSAGYLVDHLMTTRPVDWIRIKVRGNVLSVDCRELQPTRHCEGPRKRTRRPVSRS